ncbi:M48 family metalloprotease [Bacillus mangrovi]|uniref:M48 family metalloprotease n=1 Tax=Metabacillus mangrovi TaxID=1491830 RepID=A0A7X2S4U5_9BACI|nr:M48 family metallopeptidase [Metabacillus mangrovi]MTH53664.1 M48 family metalloprotease [Metabacillus mangrovi]
MNTVQKPLVHKYEEILFVFCLLFSISIFLSLFISIIGILIVAVLGLFTWFSHAMFMAHIQVNGVRLRETQFPLLYEKTVLLSKKMELKKMPEVYIIESGGILNAFATRMFSLFGKDFVVLYSDFVELAEEAHEDEVEYVIAHELAHIKRNHIGKNFFIFPAMWVPFLGEAYSRACEYTCDRMAVHYTGKPDSAIRALLVFAAGKRLFKQVQLPEFLEQYNEKKGFIITLMELFSTHPPLPKRISAIEWYAEMPASATIGKTTKYTVTVIVAVFFVFPAVFAGIGLLGVKAAETFEGVFPESEEEYYEETPLTEAAFNEDTEEVERLLLEGANPDEGNSSGETALVQTAYTNDVEMAELLLEYGANPNTLDEYGWTPLMTAAENGSSEVARLLIEAGADPDILNSDGETARSLAEANDYEEIVFLLSQ